MVSSQPPTNDETPETAVKHPSFWRRWIYPSSGEGGVLGWLRRFGVHLAIIYSVIVILVVVFQRNLIYHPSKTGRLLAAESRLPTGTVHDITFESHDGLTLHGWHLLPLGKSVATTAQCDEHLKQAEWVVLYFHGNAGDRKMREYHCRIFTHNGADVFHFDYRGFGDNPGKPNERDIITDAKTEWRYAVKQRGVPASRIVLFGESLGGGVAVQLAAHLCESGDPPAAVILTGTFSSLSDAGAHHYPWIPVRWFLRDRFESVASAPNVTCPVLQFHGRHDRIVPIELGERLFAVFPEKSENGVEKQWIVIKTGHNDIPDAVLSIAIGRLFKRIAEGR